jgi:PilZ domain
MPMERRQHERYGLEAPVNFWWRDSRNIRHRCQGLLLNISGGGVFVATDTLPPQGTLIRFSASLRTAFGGRHLGIRVGARVIRQEHGEKAAERMGLAAAINTLTLHSDEKSLTDHDAARMAAKTRKT